MDKKTKKKNRLYLSSLTSMPDQLFFTFKTLTKTFLMNHFKLDGSYYDYSWIISTDGHGQYIEYKKNKQLVR